MFDDKIERIKYGERKEIKNLPEITGKFLWCGKGWSLLLRQIGTYLDNGWICIIWGRRLRCERVKENGAMRHFETVHNKVLVSECA